MAQLLPTQDEPAHVEVGQQREERGALRAALALVLIAGRSPWRPTLVAFLLNLGTLLLTPALLAAPATLTVDVNKPGHAISPTLYGIFFEDINCSADGGLYAELVRNRNFEDSSKPDYWSAVSSGQAG